MNSKVVGGLLLPHAEIAVGQDHEYYRCQQMQQDSQCLGELVQTFVFYRLRVTNECIDGLVLCLPLVFIMSLVGFLFPKYMFPSFVSPLFCYCI